MNESDTLGVGEMDDINLPLDEIIQRKAVQEWTSTSPGGQRRGRGRRGVPRYPEHVGTGVFHGDVPLRKPPWPTYDAPVPFQGPSPMPQVDFEGGHYWAQQYQQHVFPHPPPPPAHPDIPITPPPPRNRQQLGHGRRGIRKPVSGRRRSVKGRRMMETTPVMPLNQPIDKPKKEEEKCTMTFENGNVTIQFSNVEILKVNHSGDVVLTTAGHQDGRFLKALNGVLALINVEILSEEDRPETWRVKDSFALFRYYDGIAIKGKGESTKKRAESIKKAFEQPNPKALEATLASNLAARRLGLAFDSVGQGSTPGGYGFPPGESIRITQDQQTTRTSKYSISFVGHNNERPDDANGAFFSEQELPPDPGFRPY